MEYQEIIMRIDALRNDQALLHVLTERLHQERKWSEQNHDPFIYLTILMEEVGELSEAALKARFDEPGGTPQTTFTRQSRAYCHMRDEAVHTAAVALALLECIDRDKWEWHT
jgi:NTP pyrophosphatase (non-canonical NTP hydrolase)